MAGTGSYTGVSTITRQDHVLFPFQLFSLGQRTDLSPMLYLAPRQSHLFIWRFLPVSCPSDPRPALKRQVTLFHTEVSESLSPVSCHAAAQASPSLALSAVERVRFNLKLILHPLCPEMDVKNELITTEASAIETSPAFPPNRG